MSSIDVNSKVINNSGYTESTILLTKHAKYHIKIVTKKKL